MHEAYQLRFPAFLSGMRRLQRRRARALRQMSSGRQKALEESGGFIQYGRAWTEIASQDQILQFPGLGEAFRDFVCSDLAESRDRAGFHNAHSVALDKAFAQGIQSVGTFVPHDIGSFWHAHGKSFKKSKKDKAAV